MKENDYTVKGYSLKEMRNENEIEVCRLMEKIIDKEGADEICFCGICLEDIYGLTLNRLSPKYKHSRTIRFKKDIDSSEVEAAIREAIDMVKSSPNHP